MTMTVVLGIKGGVGTTTLAMDLARALRPAMLVDLDLAHGDAAARVGVPVTATIADLATLEPGEIDVGHLAAVSYAVKGGLVVVPGPASVELAELVQPAHIERVVGLALRQQALVVDAGSSINTCVLAACRIADSIVLVCRGGEWCAGQVARVDDLLARAGVAAPRSLHVPVRLGSAGRARRFAEALGFELHKSRRACGPRTGITARLRIRRVRLAPSRGPA